MTASVNQLYEQWFQIADEDRDNTISGGEAVKFLFRSGLSQAVLGQVGQLPRKRSMIWMSLGNQRALVQCIGIGQQEESSRPLGTNQAFLGGQRTCSWPTQRR